jgi:hypothetical protein
MIRIREQVYENGTVEEKRIFAADAKALAGNLMSDLPKIAESIIEPSKVISDQYGFHAVATNDGKMTVGKILEEKDEILIIANNPFDYA